MKSPEQQLADAWQILGHAYADQYEDLGEALKDIARRLQASENPPGYSDGWNAAMRIVKLQKKLAQLRLQSSSAAGAASL